MGVVLINSYIMGEKWEERGRRSGKDEQNRCDDERVVRGSGDGQWPVGEGGNVAGGIQHNARSLIILLDLIIYWKGVEKKEKGIICCYIL